MTTVVPWLGAAADWTTIPPGHGMPAMLQLSLASTSIVTGTFAGVEA